MLKDQSRQRQQHKFWEEDLPAREGPVGGDLFFFDEVLSADQNELVISRSTNIMRGGPLLSGLLVGTLTVVATLSLATGPMSAIARSFLNEPLLGLALVVLVVLWFLVGVFFFRADLTIPSDTPIRFNRKTGKVQAYEFNWNWNPFAKWPTVVKEFDWSSVEAEIHKQAAFNGKAYVVRYALVLCICKPSTTEVVDRVTLKGNRIVTQDLHALWNYLRRYMAEGPDHLPPAKLLPVGVSFRRSFFEYMPWFDPTPDGQELRAKMPAWLLVFNGIVTLLTFWFVIPMGICHFIALRLAPKPNWDGVPVVQVGTTG